MENDEEINFDFDFDPDYFSGKQYRDEDPQTREAKKEKQQKKFENIKKDKRNKARERKRENRQKYREHLLNTMTEDELKQFYKEKALEKRKMDMNLKKGLESEYNVVFDLGFASQMKQREVRSLAIQLTYCYAMNKTIPTPICYHFCSYTDEVKEELEKMGSIGWLAKFAHQPFYDVEEIMKSGKEVVYLSPESENVLEQVNPNAFYVIGGLVDKPVTKFLSFKRAHNLEIKTARLPLAEHLKQLRSTALNINSVVEILENFIQTQNWEEAVTKGVPKRIFLNVK